MSSAPSYTRLLQIFSAKLVLEVFGGGGAIWGYSEVCTFRRPETQEHWRHVALTFASIFFIRFLLQINDYVGEIQGRRCTIDDTKSYKRFFQIFSARTVLEVFGGGGAIWGMSEALTLRYPATQEFWRYNAQISASIFFVRFLMQCRDYLEEMRFGDKYVGNFDLNRKDAVRFTQLFSAYWVLQVAGGGGAIWGFFEAATFRVPETQPFWRLMACLVFTIFFLRWMLQAKDFILEAKYGDSYVKLNRILWIRLSQVFAAKLVLEVFGGGGAIWGFSEAATFRVPDTQEKWRFRALVVGFIFMMRWGLQIVDFLIDARDEFEKAEGIADLKLNEEPLQNGQAPKENDVTATPTETSPLVPEENDGDVTEIPTETSSLV